MTGRLKSFGSVLAEISFEETRLAIEGLKNCPGKPSGRDIVEEDVPISIGLIRNGRLKMPAKTKLLISLLPCQHFETLASSLPR